MSVHSQNISGRFSFHQSEFVFSTSEGQLTTIFTIVDVVLMCSIFMFVCYVKDRKTDCEVRAYGNVLTALFSYIYFLNITLQKNAFLLRPALHANEANAVKLVLTKEQAFIKF